MDEHGQRFRGAGAIPRSQGALRGVEVDHGHLPDSPHTGDRAAREDGEGRVDALQSHHSGGQRRLHLRAGQRRAKPARGDLDLGELGHEPKPREARQLDLKAVHSPGSRLAVKVSRAGEHRLWSSGQPGRLEHRDGGSPGSPARALRRSVAGGDRAALGRGPRARRGAQRRDPRPQLPAARGPGRGRPHGGLARPLARGSGHRRGRDRVLRRPLHGRDRLDSLSREDRADRRSRRRLLAVGVDHGRPASPVEGRAPGGVGGHVRQHLGRGEGRDGLLLHVGERGPGGRAHLARARRRHGDPLRPRHVAGLVRRPRDRADRRSGALRAVPRLGRRVPRARRASGPRTSTAPEPITPAPSS